MPFFSPADFFKINKKFRNTWVSTNLVSDQTRPFVGPDLGPNCLQRLSADDTSRQSINVFPQTYMHSHQVLKARGLYHHLDSTRENPSSEIAFKLSSYYYLQRAINKSADQTAWMHMCSLICAFVIRMLQNHTTRLISWMFQVKTLIFWKGATWFQIINVDKQYFCWFRRFTNT